MKYKVIAVESDYEEVETGTCELCMSTEYINNGFLILEDENGVVCSKRVFVISGKYCQFSPVISY